MFIRIGVLYARLPAWINSWAVPFRRVFTTLSRSVATIIIGQRPAIAAIYNGTRTRIYIFTCIYCALPTTHIWPLYIATVTRRCSVKRIIVNGLGGIQWWSGSPRRMRVGSVDSDVRSALFSMLLFIFSHFPATI